MNRRATSTCLGLLLALLLARAGAGAADLWVAEPPGVRLARGFRITLYANMELAGDVRSLAFDAEGRLLTAGNGFIRTLVDADRNGAADKAIPFAAVTGNVGGLHGDGENLLFFADGGLWHAWDHNGDGQADAPPELQIRVEGQVPPARSLRRGPDGWWYFVAPAGTRLDTDRASLGHSPIHNPDGGSLMRLAPDLTACEIIAHGFLLPGGVDFNDAGDLFVADATQDADHLLPWQAPARVFQVLPAAHHGWRGGLAMPDYASDAVNTLAELDAARPAAVVCYRHSQFPPRYRNGLFIPDPVSGRILFALPRPVGAGCEATPEIFLEPNGTSGFSPTDLAVGPDGALYVAVGGYKTQAGVYRIQYLGNPGPANAPAWLATLAPNAPLGALLQAPQPLEAWSRAHWEDAAEQVGRDNLMAALVSELAEPDWRARAVEILQEVFGGLSEREARAGARAAAPEARARVAWALGRAPGEAFEALTLPLTLDPAPVVRRCALDTLADHLPLLQGNLVPALAGNFSHPDLRVRQAAARLASLLPDAEWQRVLGVTQNAAPSQLTAALAAAWRWPHAMEKPEVLTQALAALRKTGDARLRLDAVRLLQSALGGYPPAKPSLPALAAYELNGSPEGLREWGPKVTAAILPLFPANQAPLDLELSRLFAMLQATNEHLVAAVLSRISPQTLPDADVHYLAVLARLPAPRRGLAPAQTARALVDLPRKLDTLGLKPGKNWELRLAEITGRLLQLDPALGGALLADSQFRQPAHVLYALQMRPAQQRQAAGIFFNTAQHTLHFTWSAALLNLCTNLPEIQCQAALRLQWTNEVLRDDILRLLARQPVLPDRDKYLAGLAASDPAIRMLSLEALAQMPRDDNSSRVLPLLLHLKRLLDDPDAAPARALTVQAIARQMKVDEVVEDTAPTPQRLRALYQPLFIRFAQLYPALAPQLEVGEDAETRRIRSLLDTAPWARGNASRGLAVYRQRRCAECHDGPLAWGPDLGLAMAGLTREAWLNAVLAPGRQVAAPYRASTFVLRDGRTHTGLVTHSEYGYWLVQTSVTATLRLAEAAVVRQVPAPHSLMPAGLLQGVTPIELADLHAYLLMRSSQASDPGHNQTR